VGHRVGQRADRTLELGHRARPTVRDEQPDGVRFGGAVVDEMQFQAVDLGDEPVAPIGPVSRTRQSSLSAQ